MQLYDDVLLDFYASKRQEEVVRSYHYLEDLVRQSALPKFDYDAFMKDLEAPALKNHWQYLQTPPLTHYLLDQAGGTATPLSIRYLAIPPESAFRAALAPEKFSLAYSLLHHVIRLATGYNRADPSATITSLRERLDAAAQKDVSQLILLFQPNTPPNRWVLEELTDSKESFEMYDEMLPPLQAAESDIHVTATLDGSAIREVKMVDDDTILFTFEDRMMHYVLSTGERFIFKTPLLTFSGVYGDKCLFYCDSGFVNYEWKHKRWHNEVLPDIDYIILSPDHDLDIVFNLRKKRILTILEPLDRGEVKAINLAGTRVLIMDKESHGGIYDLQTGLREVDTRHIDWFAEDDETSPELAENQEDVEYSKATAIWAADGSYKLVAFGRLIVDGKPVHRFSEDILSACFAPSGDRVILCRQHDCLIYERSRRSLSQVMVY